MSNSNPLLQAAVPSLVAVLQAFQQFMVNLGTDPVQIAAKLPFAAQVFLATAQLQLPGFAASELGAVQSEINAKVAELITKLQTPPAA